MEDRRELYIRRAPGPSTDLAPPLPQPGPVTVGPLHLFSGHLPGVRHHPLLQQREGAGLRHGAGGPGHGLHRHRGQHAAGEDLPEGLSRLPPGDPTAGMGLRGGEGPVHLPPAAVPHSPGLTVLAPRPAG